MAQSGEYLAGPAKAPFYICHAIIRKAISLHAIKNLIGQSIGLGLSILPNSFFKPFIRKIPLSIGKNIRINPIVETDFMATRFQLYTNNDIVAKSLYWGVNEGLEPETFKVLKDLLPYCKVMTDIGANIGLYAIFMAKNQPQSEIFAFEPVEVIFNRLQRNIALNGLPQVHCIHKAVSNVAGHLQLRMPKGGDIPSDASLIKDFHYKDDECILETIESVTLDSFVKENGINKIDLIKIDVETAEPLVFKGASEILKSHRPFIISEVLKNCVETELIPIFKENDYLNYWISKSGLVFQDHRIDADPTYACRDFLFVPFEKVSCIGLTT
jgi:FkbM family methyltransferase